MNDNVLITSTSDGIGRELAILLIKNGYNVIGIDSKEGTITLDKYTHHICDVRKLDNLPPLPRLDYIINNAEILEPHIDPTGENILAIFNIEDKYIKPNAGRLLKSVVNVNVNVVPELNERFTTICNGSLIAYTKFLASNLSSHGIRVNSITPGMCITENIPNEILDKDIINNNLLKRWGRIDEVVSEIYKLLIDSTYTTGQHIIVDGGASIKKNIMKRKYKNE